MEWLWLVVRQRDGVLTLGLQGFLGPREVENWSEWSRGNG